MLQTPDGKHDKDGMLYDSSWEELSAPPNSKPGTIFLKQCAKDFYEVWVVQPDAESMRLYLRATPRRILEALEKEDDTEIKKVVQNWREVWTEKGLV